MESIDLAWELENTWELETTRDSSDPSDALELVERLMRDRQGHCVSDLQRMILRQVWQGRRYCEIAKSYGCTEGHAKDVGSQLWKLLSELLGEKVTKRNLRGAVERCANRARRIKHKFHGLRQSVPVSSSTVTPTQSTSPNTGQSPNTASLSEPAATMTASETSLAPLSVRPVMNWVGREQACTTLHTLISQGHRVIVIHGAGGLGKTSLAEQFLEQLVVQTSKHSTSIALESPGKAPSCALSSNSSNNRSLDELSSHHLSLQGFLELNIAKDATQVINAERWVADWLQQHFNLRPKAEFARNLALLKQQLHHQSFGILIDNLETALDAQGQFLPNLQSYGELLRMLATVPAVTLITSRDRLCDPALTLHHYALPGLELAAWQQYFARQQISITGKQLATLHRTYGGNAKAMGLVCAAIAADFDGDGTTYWELHQANPLGTADLNNLIEHQVARLQQLDPSAYRLFCRLGCYRDQGGPALAIKGLRAMLWDQPEATHLRLIDSLRRRSLLEHRQGRYSLHPALRTAAITHLQAETSPSSPPVWEQAHRHAANHWQASVTTIHSYQDALTAFEGYHHAMAIQDYQLAAQLLLHSRINQWGQFLPLASTLYRMGYVQPVLEAIQQLIIKLPCSLQRAELQNIVGDLYSLKGEFTTAIASQKAVLEQVTQATQEARGPAKSTHSDPNQRSHYYCRMLAIDAHLSLGLYHLELQDLEQAATYFQQVIIQAQDTAHHSWARKAAICLALVHAQQGQTAGARQLLTTHGIALPGDKNLEHQPNSNTALEARWAYFIQVLGQVYSQLKDFKQADCCYRQSLEAAELAHYPQVAARSRLGLAQLAASSLRWTEAQALIEATLTPLEEMGALRDLAQAEHQLGQIQQARAQTSC